MGNKPDIIQKVKTQGFELVLIGILAFIFIIGLTIGAYHIFIMDRVKNSVEFRTAINFAANSEELKKILVSSIEAIHFDDISVNEKEGYGRCWIYFNIELTDDLEQPLAVGMVKVADYWIVASAILNEGMPGQVELWTTYGQILDLLSRIDFRDWEYAEARLASIKAEIRDSALEEFLTAKLNARNGNDVYALQVLEDLESRVKYSKFSVMNEMARIHYARKDYDKAVGILFAMEEIYKEELEDEIRGFSFVSIFEGLPKDPFKAEVDPGSVMADSRRLLARIYYDKQDYENGLKWSDKAVEQAEKIESSVMRVSSIFEKALNLYGLARYDDAEVEFKNVIFDLDNPNLFQKAWAYFYRADIAARQARPADALDYYEIAVNLQPREALIRKGTIEYLMARGYIGDLEIALGLALRGIDYEVERSAFKSLASQIYVRLGLADQTTKME